MKKNSSPLFQGIHEDEFEEMKQAACLREKSFEKNEVIFHMGDITAEMGIVCSGSVLIKNMDLWGNSGILSRISPGGVFAETYALVRTPMMVEASAFEDCRILFLNLSTLKRPDLRNSSWSRKITENMLAISARKNITLSERMFCISQKTVRGRILTFLSKQAQIAGSDHFSIPYDRQQMADYLNVDRTALSKELGKMKQEGLIDFRKNQFTIQKAAATPF